MERQVFSRSGPTPDLAALADAIRPTVGDPFYLSTQLDADNNGEGVTASLVQG